MELLQEIREYKPESFTVDKMPSMMFVLFTEFDFALFRDEIEELLKTCEHPYEIQDLAWIIKQTLPPCE